MTAAAGTSEIRQPRFRLVAFDQIVLGDAPRYLVRDFVPAGGLGLVWGAPKNGKSFWTLDLALHVALGWEYRGRRVKQGAVVYIAGEGGSGFPARVEAFKQNKLGDAYEGGAPFHLLAASLKLVADHPELIAAIRVQTGGSIPALVVIDTLNRTFAGSESSDEDMTTYVAAAVAVQEAFGCAVVIVHHCGLDGTRPRGHTSLTAAVDAQISVVKDGDTFTATVECAKDGPEGAAVTCRLEVVTVGTDQDGEPITSCIVVETDDASPSTGRPKLGANQATYLEILRDAMPIGLTADEWTEEAKALGIGTKRIATHWDIRRSLKAKKLVHSSGDRWFVTLA